MIPLPPKSLMEYYFDYEKSGKEDFDKMLPLIPNKIQKILDFGGAAGRVSRHFYPFLKQNLWTIDVADVNYKYIKWGEINIPEFNWLLVKNLTSKYDFIFCQSIFTHLQNLEDNILKLKCFLNKFGLLFITFHDHVTIESHKNKPNLPIFKTFAKCKIDINKVNLKDKLILEKNKNFGCKVFYNRQYFIDKVTSFGFQLVSTIERAHCNDQTGCLFKLNTIYM